MNTLDIKNILKQKIDHLSPEELKSIWEFTQFLEDQKSVNVNPIPTEKSQLTVLERMGGYPKFFDGGENLSDRDTRQKIIAQRLKEKQQNKNNEQ